MDRAGTVRTWSGLGVSLRRFSGHLPYGRMVPVTEEVNAGTASRTGAVSSNRGQISGIRKHQTFAQRCST